MSGDLLAGAGVLASSAGAVLALLWPPGTRRSIAMLVALALLAPLVLGDQWESARVADLRDDPGRLSALVIIAAVAVAGLAAVFRRRPDFLPLALVAALPFRIPLHSGGGQANLLIPLYVVITAAVIAAAIESRGDGRAAPFATSELARWLPRVLAAIVAIYAVQSLYSDDFSKGLQNVCFFMVPFSILFVLLAEQRWDRTLLRGALVVVLAEASIFAAFGLGEYAVRDLLWNPEVIRSNELHTYFRVNSLFWDPNIYGRYVTLALLALVSLLLWTRRPRLAVAGAALCLLLWLGLATTFSQSSFVALLGGLAVLAALRWSLRWTALACAGILLAGLGGVFAGGGSLSIDLSTDQKFNKDTSGRANLVSGGLELFGDRPVWGYGSGSFAAAFREQQKGGRPAALAASHAEPVTVAAEQGAIGLLAYLALLAVAFAILIRGLAPRLPGISRAPPSTDAELLARVVVLVAFAALLLHTFAYAAFLTDPIAWALLAIGGALMSAAAR